MHQKTPSGTFKHCKQVTSARVLYRVTRNGALSEDRVTGGKSNWGHIFEYKLIRGTNVGQGQQPVDT